MFVSKKAVLVTAVAQCLVMLASNPRHAMVLQLVLASDLSGGYNNTRYNNDDDNEDVHDDDDDNNDKNNMWIFSTLSLI